MNTHGYIAKVDADGVHMFFSKNVYTYTGTHVTGPELTEKVKIVNGDVEYYNEEWQEWMSSYKPEFAELIIEADTVLRQYIADNILLGGTDENSDSLTAAVTN